MNAARAADASMSGSSAWSTACIARSAVASLGDSGLLHGPQDRVGGRRTGLRDHRKAGRGGRGDQRERGFTTMSCNAIMEVKWRLILTALTEQVHYLGLWPGAGSDRRPSDFQGQGRAFIQSRARL